MTKFLTTTALALTLALTGAAYAQDAEQEDAATDAEAGAAAEAPAADAGSEGETMADFGLDTVVATVNGTEITLGHVVAIRDRLPQNYRSLPPEVLLPGLVDQLIDQTLLSDEAVEAGAEDLARVQIQLDNERRGILSNETIATVLAGAVTEEKIAEAYEALTSEMTRATEYNASHILVETEEEANDVIAELEGGADFAELAQERSTGPSGPNGGNLGWFGPGQMVPEFDAAVQALEVGAVSEPVETQFGWHVVTVNETRLSPLPPLEQVQPDIVSQLNQDALQAHIDALREGAEIERSVEGIPAEALTTLELSAE
ncbi:peptidylprolyl isomerase [Roseobacter sp. HKCCA0434]|uniref:peptidylprolyl isomerase n=1 Tax=Roseobacter sp. HKCCA0434 TaxID=3079297 RepID=UPI002905D4D5|nr:peptidylprolyl isomerase [Roseobacter sp. HKCCA0434]